MANYLYYGNGNCTIEASNARGVEIRYGGNIQISKTCNDNFALINKDNAIIIFPVALDGYLNDLFIYRGTLKVTSLIAVDTNGERLQCGIKRVMDYAELLDSNAEDLTTVSNKLNSSHSTGTKEMFVPYDNILKNQYSKDQFYLEDGTLYSGAYHIHLKDGSCMTGSEHSDESQDLYFKQIYGDRVINRLMPTRNPSGIPPASRFRKKNRRPA